MSGYRVFHRTWWRTNPAWPNGLEPHAGRKTVLGIASTEEAARDWCRVWCAQHPAGKLSRKAEYESI